MATKPNKPVRRKLGGSLLGMDWEEITRKKIQTSKITNRLISFINGEIVLEPAQVSASLGLLKKVLPDISNVTHAGDPDKPLGLVVMTGVPRADET